MGILSRSLSIFPCPEGTTLQFRQPWQIPSVQPLIGLIPCQRAPGRQAGRARNFWHHSCGSGLSNVSGNCQTGGKVRVCDRAGRGGLVFVSGLPRPHSEAYGSKLAGIAGAFVERIAGKWWREQQECGNYAGVCAASASFRREEAAARLLRSEFAHPSASRKRIPMAAHAPSRAARRGRSE
jgi:hypothetical protein